MVIITLVFFSPFNSTLLVTDLSLATYNRF